MKARAIKLSKGDIYTGSLILVNEELPLQSKGIPPCVPILDAFPSILLHIKASACFRKILETIHALDCIVPVSGYRPFWEQQKIYKDSLVENGTEFTEKYVAKPGCSEHQSGLAIDLAAKAEHIDFIRPAFPESGICGDFRKLAGRYGFIQRYIGDKEAVTKIACEPWHFRYVGYPHSEIMEHMNLCLEEYIEYIRGFSFYKKPLKLQCGIRKIQIAYVPGDETEIHVADDAIAEISGNNADGHIITLWS